MLSDFGAGQNALTLDEALDALRQEMTPPGSASWYCVFTLFPDGRVDFAVG